MSPRTSSQIPKEKDQLEVVTPYGRGLVVRRRTDGIREIELIDRQQAQGSDDNNAAPPSSSSFRKPAVLYSKTDFPSVPVQVGCDVLCVAGRGRVVEVRKNQDENKETDVVVRISSWRLAYRSLVYCYLKESSVQVVRPKRLYEMSVFEKVERANELKEEAAAQFVKKDYKRALQTYARAVETVKFVQHQKDSPNTVRADLLVVMITCGNNAATCCTKMEQYDEGYKFARQSLALLEALEPKKGSKIHGELQKQQHYDIKVFGEWKVKSLLVMASILFVRDETDASIETCKKARDVIASYTTSAEYADNAKYADHVKHLKINDKALLKLYAKCKERRKEQLRKEKQRAQAMFAGAANTPPQRARSPEEKKSETTVEEIISNNMAESSGSVSSSPTGQQQDVQSDEQEKEKSRTMPIIEANEAELEWHKDAAFLGGLGVVLGVAGSLLLLMASRRTK